MRRVEGVATAGSSAAAKGEAVRWRCGVAVGVVVQGGVTDVLQGGGLSCSWGWNGGCIFTISFLAGGEREEAKGKE